MGVFATSVGRCAKKSRVSEPVKGVCFHINHTALSGGYMERYTCNPQHHLLKKFFSAAASYLTKKPLRKYLI